MWCQAFDSLCTLPDCIFAYLILLMKLQLPWARRAQNIQASFSVAMTFSIMTFSITTLSIMGLVTTLSINDT
jgi:hypothetical protein